MIFDIQVSLWDIENIGGSGGEAPREKKNGHFALPKWNFVDKNKKFCHKKYPYLGGGLFCPDLKFEKIPYLGGFYLRGGFY